MFETLSQNYYRALNSSFYMDYKDKIRAAGAYEIYQAAVEQYGGLGWCLQHFPGTNAHRARVNLISSLQTFCGEGYKEDYDIEGFGFDDPEKGTFDDVAHTFFRLICFTVYRIPLIQEICDLIQYLRAVSWNYTPLAQRLNVFYRFRIPILTLLHLLSSLTQIGDNNRHTGVRRFFNNALYGLFFLPYFIYCGLEIVTQAVVNVATVIFIDLPIHIIKSFIRTLLESDRHLIIATVDELRATKQLRKYIKLRRRQPGQPRPVMNDIAFDKITKLGKSSKQPDAKSYSTIYLGLSKRSVYDRNKNNSRSILQSDFVDEFETTCLVAVKVKNKGKSDFLGLLDIVRSKRLTPESVIQSYSDIYEGNVAEDPNIQVPTNISDLVCNHAAGFVI